MDDDEILEAIRPSLLREWAEAILEGPPHGVAFRPSREETELAELILSYWE